MSTSVASELRELVGRFRRAVREEPPNEDARDWLEECRSLICRWCDTVRQCPVARERFLDAARLHNSKKVRELVSQLIDAVRAACSVLRQCGTGVLEEGDTRLLDQAEEEAAHRAAVLSGNTTEVDRAKSPAPWSFGHGSLKRTVQRLEHVAKAHRGLGGAELSAAVGQARKAITELDSLAHYSLEGERWAGAYYFLATYHAFGVSPDPDFGADVDDWRRVALWFREKAKNTGWSFVSLPGAESPGHLELERLDSLTRWLTEEGSSGTGSGRRCPCGKGVLEYTFSQKELADKLGVTAGRIRQVMDKIEAAGFRSGIRYAMCPVCGVTFYKRANLSLGGRPQVKRKKR
jgi:hypothetical protein